MDVQIKTAGNWTKVEINGLPHVIFRTELFIGFHACLVVVGAQEFGDIEYILKDGVVKTQFEKIEHWEKVLEQINKHIC